MYRYKYKYKYKYKRGYISEARRYEPFVPLTKSEKQKERADEDVEMEEDSTESETNEVSSYIVDMYLKLRSLGNAQNEEIGYVSPRSLLAILRLSQALVLFLLLLFFFFKFQ